MKKIRIGILGGGFILPAHAAGFRAAAEDCEVVAIAVTHPELHRKRIHELFGPDIKVFNDYQHVVEDNNVDAVDIILPHDMHLAATIASAKAHKPVLIEKVMARNISECDQMIEACEKAGVSLTVCHDRRYDGQWIALKKVIDSGVLGEIFYWKLEHNQNVELPQGHWLGSKEKLGGGAVMSCLTHQIDALRWYGGEITSVTCMTKTLPDRMEGETVGVVGINMVSGAIANLSINWFTRSNAVYDGLWYELVHVCGTHGEAYYMANRGTYLLLHKDGSNSAAVGSQTGGGFIQVPSYCEVGHTRCILEWIKSLHGKPTNIITSGRECRGTVEVAQAAYQSVKTGQTVRLPIQAG